MKQILAGIIRHLISAGGVSTAIQAFHTGDKISATIGTIVAAGAVALSVLHKVEGAVLKGMAAVREFQPIRSDSAANPGVIKVSPDQDIRTDLRHQTGTSALGCLFALVVAVAMTGCATGNRAVPGNSFHAKLGGERVDFELRKNNEAEEIKYKTTTHLTNGVVVDRELSIKKLKSTNDPAVIDKSFAGQAVVIDAQARFAEKMMTAGKELVKEGAGAAGTGGASAVLK